MKQHRIPLTDCRRLSLEEINHQAKIRHLAEEIRATEKVIRDRIRQLEKARQRQDRQGLGLGEKLVTEQFINARIQPLRDYIRRGYAEILHLRRLSADVQAASRAQQSLF